MNIICLDAEFADNEELLELSIFNKDGEEIYHNYFKPEYIDTWRTDIHHITPEMVAESPLFKGELLKVQAVIDSADLVTGFAVDNDLRVLSHAGITGVEDKRIIDVKDMYWLLKGKEAGMSPFAVPSLLICANSLGIEFLEDSAHSASVDTKFTLNCFDYLLEQYRNLQKENQFLSLVELTEGFISDIDKAKSEYVAEWAKGYIRVYKVGDYYKLKYGRQPDEESGKLVFEVGVQDRYKAEYEIRKLLKKKEVPGRFGLYKLTPKLIDDVRNYRNEYDAEESAWCKKIIRNLSKLTL